MSQAASTLSMSPASFPVISEAVIGNGTVQTVNARDLHTFLEVGKDFSTWLKARIDQFEFVLGQDFEAFDILSSPVLGSSKARPQKIKEYALTLDMAKELSMVERNARGKEARRYFIACERKLMEQKLAAPHTSAPSISHNAKRAYRALTANRVMSLPALTRRIRGSMNAATVWEAVGELEAVGAVRVIPRQAHNKAPIYIEIIAPLPALAPQSQGGKVCPVLRIKDAIDLMRQHMPSVVVGHPNITSHATAHMELAAARETATSTAGLIYQLNLAAVMAGELSEYKNNDPFLRDQSRTIQHICERAACAIA